MPSRDRRLRVLMITHNYPRFSGDPAGAFIARIAEGVTSHGHDVRVIAPHDARAADDESRGGVQVHRFRYAPESLERVAYTGGLHQGTLRSPVAALMFPGFLLSFGASVRRMIRRFRPNLIHAHWWFPAGWLARQRHIPYIITAHGSDVRLLERSSLVRRWALGVLNGAAKVTAVSGFLARDIVRLLPDLHAEVAVAPMPVDVESFQAGAVATKASPPRILYAGNLVQSKGVDILLRAAAQLKERNLDFQLKVLGEGPELNDLQFLAHQLGLDSHITWASFVPLSDMPAEYGASTVTVLASRGSAEGLGLTLVEALLAGSAVVGTPAGGIPEVVRHGETGLLARDGSPHDLADQIARLLTDGPLRSRLTGAGKDYVLRTYSPTPTIGKFLELYHAAAHDCPHG